MVTARCEFKREFALGRELGRGRSATQTANHSAPATRTLRHSGLLAEPSQLKLDSYR